MPARKKVSTRKGKMTAPIEEMARYNVRIPVVAANEIESWADAARIKRSAFMSMAVVIGARQLARQLVPEMILSPDAMKKMADVLAQSPALQKALGLSEE